MESSAEGKAVNDEADDVDKSMLIKGPELKQKLGEKSMFAFLKGNF